MNSLVSIVIPAYNHGHFIAEAIASALGQNYRPIDVIVVNDGSTDDTPAVVARFPSVRSLTQDNRGLAAARNAGLAACRGELVIFLDADDRLVPGAVETGARILSVNPALGFCAGYSRFIAADGQPQPTSQPDRAAGDAYVALLRRNSIRNPAMVMFRRAVVEAAGGFDDHVDACADYALYLRISRDHPVAFHQHVVAEYRKHGGNMSNNSALMLRQLEAVMRRQRPHLTTDARRAAFREGLRNIRSYYGDRIFDQVRQRLRDRTEWRRSAADLATVAWCHPAGVMEHARRKALVWLRGRP